MAFKILLIYNYFLQNGFTLLYRACLMNDGPLVQQLLEYGAVLSPPPGLFDLGPGMWRWQDKRQDTILHYAVKKKFDLAVIQVILKADPSTCKVRNGSGLLPVEQVLKGQDERDGLLYEELPLDLLDILFKRMQSYEKDPAIPSSTSLLYRACESVDIVLVRRLLEYRAVLNPLLSLVQAGQQDTILHLAVKRKYDLAVIQVILKADPSACKARNGSYFLPVEVVLKGQEEVGGLLYQALPLELLDMLFEIEKDPSMVISLSLLYEACDLNDVVLVKRLLEYVNARLFTTTASSLNSLWCGNDSHLASRNKKEI